MTDPHCPRPAELAGFALGTLEESVADQVAVHVEHCADCDQTLRNLDGTVDLVLTQLRQPPVTSPYAADTAFQERLAAVKAFGTDPPRDALHSELTPLDASEVFPQLRDYRILTKLGQGGMGAVYKALHTRLEKIVAIKVLSASLLSKADAIARFSREMKAIGRLEHPNLIRAHDAGEHDGQHYLVMEYIDGVDLSELAKSSGRLPIPEACELIRQAARGLEYAHQRGMVHRDIKPSNLMLTTEGQVKVLDMGLALLSHSDEPIRELTSTGQIMGTVDYMAPEQGGDTHHVDIRADIYSLGATLYKLLTGQTPFASANYTTLMKKLMALATVNPVPVRELRPEVSAELANVIDRMLAKSPGQRFDTPAQVAQALLPFATGANLMNLMGKNLATSPKANISRLQPLEAQTVLAAEALTAPQGLQSTATTTVTAPHRGRQRPPAMRWLAWGGLSAALLIAGYLLIWNTDNGATVKVEINDPLIQAQFDGAGILITNADKDQEPFKISVAAPTKPGDRTLIAGSHKLIIRRGDLRFETNQFELKKSGDTVLKVEVIDDKLAVTQNNQPLPITPRAAVAQTKPGMKPSDSPAFEQWIKDVQGMPAERQVSAVLQKLKDFNPGFSGLGGHLIQDNSVSAIDFTADQVTDLSPLRALSRLKKLECSGSMPDQGKLADLSPLAGLKLEHVNVSNTLVSDLSALKGMPLTIFLCGGTRVTDLAPLRGASLELLWCYQTPVFDLTPIAGMPLKSLSAHNTKIVDLSPLRGAPLQYCAVSSTSVSDLSPLQGAPLSQLECNHLPISTILPLKGMRLSTLMIRATSVTDLSLVKDMPLKSIHCDFQRYRDSELLRSITTLESINDKPTADFWKDVAAQQAVFDAWERGVITLPPEQQIAEVVKKLRELNPNYDGSVFRDIESEVVTFISIPTEHVTDLSPVRALRKLKRLHCGTSLSSGPLSDLSPLRGLSLTEFHCGNTKVSDLSPLLSMPLERVQLNSTPVADLSALKGMLLTHLELAHSPVTDLSPLRNMPLVTLYCNHTQVADLTPLHGMSLKIAYIDDTLISDLSPLKGMPLEQLDCRHTRITDVSAVAGMPLKELSLNADVADLSPLKDLTLKLVVGNFKPERDADILRAIKTLESINGKPAAEFWKSFEKQ